MFTHGFAWFVGFKDVVIMSYANDSIIHVELFVSRGLHVFALLLLLYVSYTVSYTFLVS